MKKILSLILCVLLITGVTAAAGSPAALEMRIQETVSKPGETVEIPLALTQNPGFCYLKVNFTYDPAKLELVRIDNGNVSTDAFTVTDKAITWDTDKNAMGTGTLCTFVFTVKQNAEGAANVTVTPAQCFNYDEQTVSANGCEAAVTVKTDPGHGDGSLVFTMAASAAAVGQTAEIPLALTQNPGFCYLKVNFTYDADKLELVRIDNGNVSTDAFTVMDRAITWDTDKNAAGTGTLCTFVFTVKPNAEGAANVTVTPTQCFNYDEQPVSANGCSAALQIEKGSDRLPGDVDNDGRITAADARLALRRAVDLETYAEGTPDFIACDIDKDGKATAGDARIILRIAVDLESVESYK